MCPPQLPSGHDIYYDHLFPIETSDAKIKLDQSKIFGTALYVGGSMLMTFFFYKWALIPMPASGFQWRYRNAEEVVERGGVQCLLIAVVERDLDEWALGFDIRLAKLPLYMLIGLVGSSFVASLMSWAIEKLSPLYISMFSTFHPVIVVVLSWVILDEKLYVSRSREMAQGIEEYLPAIATMALQLGYALLNVLSKLMFESDVCPYILIAYCQTVATIILDPIAYLLERKTGIKITGKILLQILISSIFGATFNHLLYFGLKYTTSTIACTLPNILPFMTFIMSILSGIGWWALPLQCR